MAKVIRHHSLTDEQRERKRSQVRTLTISIVVGLAIIILIVSLVATQTAGTISSSSGSSDIEETKRPTSVPSLRPSTSPAPSATPSAAPSLLPSSSPTVTWNRTQTTIMAERRLFCSSDDVPPFPNVLEQCECQNAIEVIPADVMGLRQQLIEDLMPYLYNDDDIAAIFDESSSCSNQNIALVWLASGNNRRDGIFLQRYVLSLLHISTGGQETWNRLFGWWTSLPECQWLGVSCDSGDFVTSLELNDNELSGSIPTELAAMDSLQVLSTAQNSLLGTLPILGNILEYYVSNNQFSRIALSGEDFAVRHLDLSRNNLDGIIPSNLGKATKLTTLNLANNNFRQSLPDEISKLVLLENLDISSNDLTGALPDAALNGLSKLATLVLSNNQWTGALPSSYGDLESLKSLILTDTTDRGTVGSRLPSELGRLSNLERLFLQSNAFSGEIPTEFGNLEALSRCELWDNLLEGAVPTELGFLGNLELLNLEQNSLTGEMPSEVCALREGALESLSVNCEVDCQCCTFCG